MNKEQRQSSKTSVIPAQAGTHDKLRHSGPSMELVNSFNKAFADGYVGPGLRRDDGRYFGILRAVCYNENCWRHTVAKP